MSFSDAFIITVSVLPGEPGGLAVTCWEVSGRVVERAETIKAELELTFQLYRHPRTPRLSLCI